MNLLVDLDGTITDPASGILGSVRYALEKLGLAAPQNADMTWVIGPPLRVSLPKLGVPEDQVPAAIAYYREKYVGGAMFDCQLCDGIEPALRELKAGGDRLFVATSKPHVYARQLIAHFGLSDVFVAVHGAELDGRNDAKKDVIASILETHDIAPATCIMIGDTPFDVEGARHHNIPTVGVSWGHGEDRLAAANPARLIHHARDLKAAVESLRA